MFFGNFVHKHRRNNKYYRKSFLISIITKPKDNKMPWIDKINQFNLYTLYVYTDKHMHMAKSPQLKA